jgi:ABC-type transport system involved in multi-copper enzyme maturation permease subunit
MLLDYGLYHGMFIFLFLLLAVVNLRKESHVPVPLARRSLPGLEDFPHEKVEPSMATHTRMLPYPGNEIDPLWRKEILHGYPTLVGFMYLATLTLSLLVMFLVFAYLLAWLISPGSSSAALFQGRQVHGAFLRFVSILVLAGIAAVEAFRTARCITQEREQRTLESLLAAPLRRGEILWMKWSAGLRYFRWVGVVLVLCYVVGMASLTVDPVEGSLFLVAAAIHLLFFITLGTWLSVSCRTTLQAQLIMGVIIGTATLGPWLLLPEGMLDVQVIINPLQCWYQLSPSPYSDFRNDPVPDTRLACTANLAAYVLASLLLAVATWRRFEKHPLGKGN